MNPRTERRGRDSSEDFVRVNPRLLELWEWRKTSILCTLALVLAAGLLPFLSAIELLENRSHTLRFLLRGPGKDYHTAGNRMPAPPDNRIVVVEVEDETEAQWTEPQIFWNARFATIARRALTEYGAAWVGLDTVPAVNVDQYLDTMGARDEETMPRPDNALLEAIVESRGHIVLPNIRGMGEEPLNPNPIFAQRPEVAANLGFINLFPAADGVIRQAPIFAQENAGEGTAQPSFAGLLAFRSRFGSPGGEVGMPEDTERVTNPQSYTSFLKGRVPVLRPGVSGFYINYGAVPYRSIPANRFGSGALTQEEKDWVRGAVVLIGMTYPGSGDRVAIPGSPAVPGVYVQAEAVGTLLSGRALQRLSRTNEGWITLAAALFSLLLAAVLPPHRFWLALLWTILGAAGYASAAHVAFLQGDWLLPVVAPGMACIAPCLLFYAFGFIEEVLRRETIMERFGRLATPQFARLVSARRYNNPWEPTRQRNVVLFFDIRRSTRRTYQAQDPVAAMNDLNELFRELVPLLDRAGGLLYRYTGDGFITVFGPPADITDMERRAVQAAIALIARIKEMNVERAQVGQEPWEVGIGIHVGEMAWGALGSEGRADLTLIGDTINFCSRLEPYNKKEKNGEYDTGLVISEDVCEGARLERQPILELGKRIRRGTVTVLEGDDVTEPVIVPVQQYFLQEEIRHPQGRD